MLGALKGYIETCKIAGHSPSTIDGYQKMMNRAYGPILDKPVNRLTAADVQKAVNAYARGRSPKSVSNAYGLLHKVLRMYRPQLDLGAIVLPSKKNQVNGDAGVVIPDDDMVRRLLDHTRETDDTMYRCILIASQTGLRRGELAALLWGDLQEGVLRVNKAVVKAPGNKLIVKAPKSGAGCRNVRVPSAV